MSGGWPFEALKLGGIVLLCAPRPHLLDDIMKIATWNINGVKARIENLLHWLKEADPDIVCLQEIKSVDEQFPRVHGADESEGQQHITFDDVIRDLYEKFHQAVEELDRERTLGG
jgi:exonuclease III